MGMGGRGLSVHRRGSVLLMIAPDCIFLSDRVRSKCRRQTVQVPSVLGNIRSVPCNKRYVEYQGPKQTNQDSIEAWLKHEEPNSTGQQQEVINQTLAPARLNTACNRKTKGTLNDNSNAGIW